METEGETTGGAGGKLRRQRPRRPPASPYARPQERRWISRLVDPARRLIAGGVTRIFPYLLPKSPSLLALSQEQEDHDRVNTESKQPSGSGDKVWTVNLAESGFADVPGPSGTPDKSIGKNISSDERGKKALTTDDGLSEIERLMDGKSFTRDEIDRLIEILNAKAVGSSNVDCEKENLEVAREMKAERPPLFQMDMEKPDEARQENMDLAPLATPGPLKLTMAHEFGRSPIELARAYMGSRASDISLGSRGLSSKEERLPVHEDEIPAKSFLPSPSPKPSTCWPGAMLQDKYGYMSPKSQRMRYGLHNFPRTPYSRSIFSKSKTKLKEDSSRPLDTSITPFQQSEGPYGQLKSQNNMFADEPGSVGPIRRARNKAVPPTSSRGSVYAPSPAHPSTPAISNLPEGFFPAIKKNLEHGPSSSSKSHGMNRESMSSLLATPSVHPHSSQMARTILEHLERTQPTPKDKYAELKLATSWRKESNKGVGYQKSVDHANKNSSDHLNEGSATAFANDTNNAKKENTLAAGKFGSTVTSDRNNAGASFIFPNMQDSQVKVPHEGFVSSNAGAELSNMQKPSNNSLGTKPTLAAITVENPMAKWKFPSSNNMGFSFPVPASSGTSSEPPTPTILPSTLPKIPDQPKEEATVAASYSFGGKTSSQPLVFSFPCDSGTRERDDVSDIKFEFGSDKSMRISFATITRDSICC